MNKKFFLNDFFVIFFIALSLRLILLAAWHSSGQGSHLTGDSPSYMDVGESFSQGQGFTVDGLPSTRRGPGYPLFLALAMHLGFPVSAQILQAIVDSLSAFFIYRIGLLLWNRKVGIIAGLSYSVNYIAMKQCVQIMPEILFTFFVILSFYFYYQSHLQTNYKKIFVSALCSAIAVLTKDVLFFYYIAWGLGFLLLGDGKRRAYRLSPVIFILVYSLSFIPWIIHNSAAQGKFTLLTNSTGLSLYLGNNPTVVPQIKGEDWTLKVNTAAPPDVAGDEVHRNSAVQYIKAYPKKFLKNAFFKLGRFWYPFYSDSPKIIKGYCGLLFIYLAVFLGLGVWQNRKRWIELLPFWGMLLYLSLIHSITISSIRYRFVLEPFLLLLAASAAAQIRLHSCLKKAKISPLSKRGAKI